MEHRAYPKIAARSEAAARGGPWVATEKVHGANVVVACDGREVRFGKRKAWLAPDEPFFGWQLLRAELVRAALAAHAVAARANARTGLVVHLYGELFGGAYPHPDVPALPGASPVQTGIWYAPDVRLALFDVFLEPIGLFLAHRDVEAVAAEAGMACVPLLGRGPRSELERLPVRFPTRVPARLGLPALVDNLAEGLVLKPDVAAAPAERLVLKRKIPEFDEARFDEAEAWDPDVRLTLEQLLDLGARLINPPRLASARSKLGDAAALDALVTEVALDALVDLTDAFPRALREMTAADADALTAHLSHVAARQLGAR